MRAVIRAALAAAVALLALGVVAAPTVLDGRTASALGRPPAAAAVSEEVMPRARPAQAPAGGAAGATPGRATPGSDSAAASRTRATSPAAPPLTDGPAIAAARRFAAAREGDVAFAVLEPSGRLRGLRPTALFPSASVSKAMLLVAILRRARGRELTPAERELLRPMVTASDNDAADAVYAQVGDAGLAAVGEAAGMRRLALAGAWSEAGLTPADQARLFLRLDAVVPARHRRYARRLLSEVVAWQRWGIPEVVARRPGAAAYFKGGWRPGLTHQVALVERGPRRIALAVMTSGGPDMAYDEDTIAGIARRVLPPAPRSG
jgi:hypothetical protein